MHSDIGPAAEAQAVYIEPSRLAERLAERLADTSTRPVILWDVGLGIAANALAAIEVAETLAADTRGAYRLEIHSFESKLGGIELALAHPECFPWLDRHSPKLRSLLETGTWSGTGTQWWLHRGDFDPRLAPTADVVFYDFYAPAACPELWGLRAFQRLRPFVREDGIVCTYSCSTAVRSALLLAGFYVGRGEGTARKRETTVASPSRGVLQSPLTIEWLAKLRRSQAPFPSDAPASSQNWEIIHDAL